MLWFIVSLGIFTPWRTPAGGGPPGLEVVGHCLAEQGALGVAGVVGAGDWA